MIPLPQCIIPLITTLSLLLAGTAYGDRLDDIRQQGILRVGVNSDHSPFGFHSPDGTISGFEIDIAQALAERLGVTLSIHPVPALERIIPLTRGEVDLLIASLLEEPRYQDRLSLISPGYYASGTSVLVWRGVPLQYWNGLSGQGVCGIQGSQAMRQLEHRVAAHFIGLETTPAALSALKRRLCTALLHDSSVLVGLLQQAEWRTDFVMPLPPLEPLPWHLGVLPGETRWAGWLTATLVSWHREGYLLELEKTWQLPPSDYLRNMHLVYHRENPHP